MQRDSDPSAAKAPYNIIFIVVDQQTHRLLAESEYTLPATDAIASHGVTFANHYIASAMCTASRAAFFTGRPPQSTRVIDQMQYAFSPTLDPSVPNIGSVLRDLGYKTAYFGKFELDKSILAVQPTVNYKRAIATYGFDEFSAGGDIGSAPRSGFENDPFIAGESVRWLRAASAESRRTGQPFFMVASFVNPHDIMFADANLPGQTPVQKAIAPMAAPPLPRDPLYDKHWSFELPASLQESLDAPGMPRALSEYKEGWDGWSGAIPTDRKDMWTIFYNYYLNTIQDNQRNIQQIVDVLDDRDLWRDTVVVFTADHGEMAGAHGGLKGKGPFAYEENAHVPLIVAHPSAKAGTTCSALTSHLDLLPTFVGLTGLPDAKRPQSVKELPGHDFSALLGDPESAAAHAVRPGVLYNYLGVSTVDGEYLRQIMTCVLAGKSQPPIGKARLDKRGLLSFVFDGRYKFARFHAPTGFNTPTTLEEILANNDLQLFDLQSDPAEVHNLALEPQKHRETILRMNQLLNDLVAAEVGVNDGRFLQAIIESSKAG
ncbi:MAG: sulfatase-like hydrolase/transferase [Candidatus Eremiobacteraeota bacterium]|nr:sulfatase-like hydrolase/transferase [Candidatus Eremiobacteraeota bacterium]